MNRRRPNPHHDRDVQHQVGSAYQRTRWSAGAPAGSAVAGRPAHHFFSRGLRLDHHPADDNRHRPWGVQEILRSTP
jgi:hypothetical protein